MKHNAIKNNGLTTGAPLCAFVKLSLIVGGRIGTSALRSARIVACRSAVRLWKLN